MREFTVVCPLRTIRDPWGPLRAFQCLKTANSLAKNNNHHPISYLRKTVTSKPKNIANCGCFYFLAPEKFFPMVIWFLIFKFFLMKLLPTTVKGLECPKSTNIRIFGYPDYFQADFFVSWLNILQMCFLI